MVFAVNPKIGILGSWWSAFSGWSIALIRLERDGHTINFQGLADPRVRMACAADCSVHMLLPVIYLKLWRGKKSGIGPKTATTAFQDNKTAQM